MQATAWIKEIDPGRRQVFRSEEKRFLTGRQIASMIGDHLRLSETFMSGDTNEPILDFNEILQVGLHNSSRERQTVRAVPVLHGVTPYHEQISRGTRISSRKDRRREQYTVILVVKCEVTGKGEV